MVRTRTIKEAAAYFREEDPQTSLTETAIRTLLRSGAVPSVRVGKEVPCIPGSPGKLPYGRNRAHCARILFQRQARNTAKNKVIQRFFNILFSFYRRREIK